MRRLATPILLAVLVFAALVRGAGLGVAPLDAGEASRSVAAWWTVEPPGEDLARLLPRPDSALLLGLDYALFWLFDSSSDVTARLIPALAGTALVALAVLLRSQSPAGALALAFLLAVDPWLVAMSRRASGAILGTGAALACWLLMRRLEAAAPTGAVARAAHREWRLLAVAAGLLLVAGSAAWDFLPPIAAAALLLSRDRRHLGSPRPRASALFGVAAIAALAGATSGLLQWRGPALVSSSLDAWLASWTGIWREMSMVSIARANASVLLYQIALGSFAVVGLSRAWRSAAASAAGSAKRAGVQALLLWIGWGALMQLRSSGGAETWLALELPLLLAAALGLEDLVAAPVRGGAGGVRRVVLGAVAVVGAAAALAGTVMAPVAPALPAARRLAGDLSVLLERPVVERPRIEVVTGPRIDGVLAWYLRDVSVRWVASDAMVSDEPRVVAKTVEGSPSSASEPAGGPRYTVSVAGGVARVVELR